MDENCGAIPTRKMSSVIEWAKSFTVGQITRALCILMSSLGLDAREREEGRVIR
jgi:hypothetical protein